MRRFLFQLLVGLACVGAATSLGFFVKVREEDAVMKAFLADATLGVPGQDPEALAVAVAQSIHRRTGGVVKAEDLPLYEHLESASFFNVASATSVRYGVYGLVGQSDVGPCGTMTRVTLEALHRLRIPARKLQLLADESRGVEGHTMLEFRSGDRWLVLSPSDGAFTWRTRDGRIATLAEIQADPAIFAQIFERFPNYPYRFDHAGHIRWAKLPPLLRGFFRLVLGQRGYDEAFTPLLYDQPRRLLLIVALSASIVCAWLAWLLRPRKRPGLDPSLIRAG